MSNAINSNLLSMNTQSNPPVKPQGEPVRVDAKQYLASRGIGNKPKTKGGQQLLNVMRSTDSALMNTGGRYGKSKYDKEMVVARDIDFNNIDSSFEDVRSRYQSGGAVFAAGLGRVATSATAEILKMPGFIVGGLAALGAEEGKGWDTFLNNDYIKSIDEAKKNINDEFLTVYQSEQTRNGDIWDALSSGAFWAVEGADAGGMLLSMFAPGAALKGLTFGSKFMNGATKLRYLNNAEKALETSVKYKNVANMIDTAFLGSANAGFEAASGASSQMADFDEHTAPRLTDKILSQKMNVLEQRYANGEISTEEYKNLTESAIIDTRHEVARQKEYLGKNVFIGYMASSLAPNFIQAKFLYGLDDAAQSITKKGGKGFFSAHNAQRQAKKIGRATAMEGFYEEGVQTTVENYYSDKAKQGKLGPKLSNNFNLGEMSEAYLEMLGTTEGQKAVILGALMGAGVELSLGNISDAKHDKRLTQIEAGISKYRKTTDQILAEGIYQRDEKGVVITDKNGKPKVDTSAAKNLLTTINDSLELNEMYDRAVASGDNATISAIMEQALINQAVNYGLYGDEGIELLREENRKQIEAMTNEGRDTTYAAENAKLIEDYAKIAMVNSQVYDKYVDNLNLPDPQNEAEAQFQQEFLARRKGSYLYGKGYIVSKERQLSGLKEQLKEIKKTVEPDMTATEASDIYAGILSKTGNGSMNVLNTKTGETVKDSKGEPVEYLNHNEFKAGVSLLFDNLSPEDKVLKSPMTTRLEKQVDHLKAEIKRTQKEINDNFFDPAKTNEDYESGLANHKDTLIKTAEAEKYSDVFDALNAIKTNKDLKSYLSVLKKDQFANGELPDAIKTKVEFTRKRLADEFNAARKKAAANNQQGNGTNNTVPMDDILNLAYDFTSEYDSSFNDILNDPNTTAEEKKELITDLLYNIKDSLSTNPDLSVITFDGNTYTANELSSQIFNEIRTLLKIGQYTDIVNRVESLFKSLSDEKAHQLAQQIGTIVTISQKLNQKYGVAPSDRDITFMSQVAEALDNLGYSFAQPPVGQVTSNFVVSSTFSSSKYHKDLAPEVIATVAPAVLKNGVIVKKGVVDTIQGSSNDPNEGYLEGTMANALTDVDFKFNEFARMMLNQVTAQGVINNQGGTKPEEIKDEVDDDTDIEEINRLAEEARQASIAEMKRKEASVTSGNTPNIKILSTNEYTDEVLPMSSPEFVAFERSGEIKIGKDVFFEVDIDFFDNPNIDANHKGKRSVALLQGVNWDYTQLPYEEQIFVLHNLPIKANIDGFKSSIEAEPSTADAHEIYMKNAYKLRMNILHAMSVEKSPTPKELKSQVTYQLNGHLNMIKDFEIEPGVFTYSENDANSLMNPNNVPLSEITSSDLNILVGRDGGLYDIFSTPNQNTPTVVGDYSKGEIYVPIKRADGSIYNLKLNASYNSQERSEAIYLVLKALMTKGLDSNMQLKNFLIDDALLMLAPEEAAVIIRVFEKELAFIEKNARNNVNKNMHNLLAMTLYLDGKNPKTMVQLLPDGTLVLGTKIQSLIPGLNTHIFKPEDMANDLYKDEIVKYFKYKRRNIVIPGYASYNFNRILDQEVGASMATPEYVEYLLSTNALNTNATIVNGSPFTGKQNMFVDGNLSGPGGVSAINSIEEFVKTPAPATPPPPPNNSNPPSQPQGDGVKIVTQEGQQPGKEADTSEIDAFLDSFSKLESLKELHNAYRNIPPAYATALAGLRKDAEFRNSLADKENPNRFKDFIIGKINEIKSLQKDTSTTVNKCGI